MSAQDKDLLEQAIHGDFSGVGAWLGRGQENPDLLDRILREAAARDAVAICQALVAAGANPYGVDDQGRTAFNRAASNGLKALAWLTQIAFEDTQKPASERRWPTYGLNTPSGHYGSTLITYAAKVATAITIRQMAAAGADLAIINGSGWTLLHCAAVMPGRTDVLGELITAFRAHGLGHLIPAKSTHVYETDYAGHNVIYGAGLTAAGLCKARLAQDPACPRELANYIPILLSGAADGHRAGSACGCC